MTVPGRWLVLRVSPEGPEDAAVLSEGLVQAGGRAVLEDGGHLVTYLPEPPDPDATVRGIRDRLRRLTERPSLEVESDWQPHEDWEHLWRRGLAPRRVSHRIVVTPSWMKDDAEAEAGSGDVIIVVDPGLAFGTAEHGTTRGCLRLLESGVRPGDRILDVGSGSGILSIAAARLGAARVLAVEGDPYAVDAALDNVQRNGTSRTVEVRQAWVDDAFLRGLGTWDGVVANLERGLLEPLLGGLGSAVGPGGWLIVSGILAGEWSGVVAALEALGLQLLEEDAREDEWRSGRLVRVRNAG